MQDRLCNISGIAIAPTNPAVVYAVTSTDGSVPSSAWVSTDATCTAFRAISAM